jgi:hypothetical protein
VLEMARRIPDRHRKAVQRSDPPIPLLWVASFYFAGRRAHSGGESIVFADVNFALALTRLALKTSAVSAIL